MKNERAVPWEVGDRVRCRGATRIWRAGVVVPGFSKAGEQLMHRDDGQNGCGPNEEWILHSHYEVEAIEGTTTEPRAQEVSSMQAGKAIIWAKDEDGRRESILHQDVKVFAYETKEQFKFQALGRAKIKPEDYSPKVHDVVLVPFGN